MRNSRSGTRDMLISLAVLLVPMALIYYFFSSTPAQPNVPTVSYQPQLGQAQSQSPYPVLVPNNLPSGWRATRVNWARPGDGWLQGTVATGYWWELGFLSPQSIYIAVQQRDGQVGSFVGDATNNATPDGTVVVGGQTWTKLTSGDGMSHALERVYTVATSKGPDTVTALITGDTGYDQLQSFASALTPQSDR